MASRLSRPIIAAFAIACFGAAPGFGAAPEGAAAEVPALSTAPFELPTTTIPSHIDFQADSFEYLQSTAAGAHISTNTATMLLKGRVWVRQSTWTLHSGQLLLDMDARRGYASQGFVMDDGLNSVSGAKGDFDFDTHDGHVVEAYAEYPPWRIWSHEAWVDGRRRAHFKTAYFTSCNKVPPHYHFRASRAWVKPRKSISATNVVFFLGPVPLFYSPYLWKSLDPNPLIHTKVVPGYDKRNGTTVRSTTLYSLGPSLYGKLYLDYFGHYGPGMGTEAEFHKSQDARGSLYAYRVHDNRLGEERWIVLANHYQALNPIYSVQARIQAQSDSAFRNDYIRSDAFRITPDLTNSVALVRHTGISTMRLSYSRQDSTDPSRLITDPNHNNFLKISESAPRFDLQLPLAMKRLPILPTFSFFADNHTTRGLDYLQRSAGGDATISQRYLLGHGLVFTPTAGFKEAYEYRIDGVSPAGVPEAIYNTYTGRYNLGTNLRINTWLGTWDAGNAFTRRLKTNTMVEDAGANDYGIETNALTLQDTLRPSRLILVRVNGGYDMRHFRDHEPGFRNRVQPFIADMNLSPKHNLQFTVRENYQLNTGNQSFLMQADVGDRLRNFIGFGMSHTEDHPQDYLASNEFGLAPASSTWRLRGAIRYSTRYLHDHKPAALGVYDKELALIKDFHDFHTRFQIRIRPGPVAEAQVLFELRIGQEKERRIVNTDWESEWFPWRRDPTYER